MKPWLLPSSPACRCPCRLDAEGQHLLGMWGSSSFGKRNPLDLQPRLGLDTKYPAATLSKNCADISDEVGMRIRSKLIRSPIKNMEGKENHL